MDVGGIVLFILLQLLFPSVCAIGDFHLSEGAVESAARDPQAQVGMEPVIGTDLGIHCEITTGDQQLLPDHGELTAQKGIAGTQGGGKAYPLPFSYSGVTTKGETGEVEIIALAQIGHDKMNLISRIDHHLSGVTRCVVEDVLDAYSILILNQVMDVTIQIFGASKRLVELVSFGSCDHSLNRRAAFSKEYTSSSRCRKTKSGGAHRHLGCGNNNRHPQQHCKAKFLIHESYALYSEICLFHSFCILADHQLVYYPLDIAFHEGGEVVEGVVDAVVGNTSLRLIVGADLRGAVACGDHCFAARSDVTLSFGELDVIELGTQHLHGQLSVLEL